MNPVPVSPAVRLQFDDAAVNVGPTVALTVTRYTWVALAPIAWLVTTWVVPTPSQPALVAIVPGLVLVMLAELTVTPVPNWTASFRSYVPAPPLFSTVTSYVIV